MAEPGDSEQAADTVRAPSPRAGRLTGSARRLLLLGSAVALAGSLAVTGTASPGASPAKSVGGAYLSEEVVLEAAALESAAQVASLPQMGLSSITLVARSAPAVKAAHGDPFTGAEPLCVSYPVAPGSFRLTSPYGYRTHPIFGTYSMHMGVDFAAPLGTAIHAVTDGTVVYTGAGRLGRSSELVILEHTVEDTTFYSWYVHMYPDGVFVEVGQRVVAGEVIAEVGNNGNSTGPHLHFEIHTEQAAGLENVKTPQSRESLSARISVPSPANQVPGAEQSPTPDPSESPSPGETPSPDPSESPSPGPGETPSPDPSETPSPDPSESPSPAPGESPSPDPSESPSPGETPSPDPSPGPSESPSPEETPSPQPSENPQPTPEPTEPPAPEATPSPQPSVTPSPSPTAEPTPAPTTEPTDEPTAEPSELPEDPQGERPRHPFPVRAYGTTVEPLSFLASLGLVMVAPQQCGAP